MITAEQLRKAAQLIVINGWTRGTREDKDGRLCPVGALFKAIHGHAWAHFNGYRLLDDFQTGATVENDARDCTKDAAVMFLLLCAEAREHGDL